jgi:hypothetical protein
MPLCKWPSKVVFTQEIILLHIMAITSDGNLKKETEFFLLKLHF